MVEPKKYSINIDTSLFETFDGILNTKDFNLIQEFVTKQESQLISIWSYYNTVNDHLHFTSCTNRFNKFLRTLNENPSELRTNAIQILKLILESHSKILYRSLSSMKPSITNPILNLLRELVKFDVVCNDYLINNFDFNLAILPKLVTTAQYRFNFIDFWIQLLQNFNHLTRKDFLLEYKKINTNIYKSLPDDSSTLISKFIDFFDHKVLQEPHFNKLLKCKVLNEFVLGKFVTVMMANDVDADLKTKTYDFLVKITTDDKLGLNFPDEKIWSLNHNGTPVVVNLLTNLTFKIHNKLIYNVILQLKPFEDDLQLRLIMEIFSKIPELVAPYTQHLFQIHGANDPKLTSFWIGQTLLLEEIIKLPVPSKFQQLNKTNLDDELSLKAVSENIIPSSLTKSCLIKCLQCESLLIRQLTLQVILLVFDKLTRVLKALNSEQSHFKMQLLNLILKTKLPELSLIVSFLNEDLKSKKLLLLSYTMIIKEYLFSFPTLSLSLPLDTYFMKSLQSDNEDAFSGIELVILENYLELQENINDSNSVTSKWWNSTNDKNSFYTNLLKLSSNSVLYNKIYKILVKLTSQTIIFDAKTLISPNFALVQACKFNDDWEPQETRKIWKFIDEIISRCARTPYKYLDQARELLDNGSVFDALSPLVVTLFEQWKYVADKDSEKLHNWFCLLMRYLVLVGESSEPILKLFETHGLKPNGLLNFKNYESSGFIKDSSVDKAHFENLKNESFFEFVLNSPLNALRNSRIPVNQMDIVGLVRRLEFIVHDENLTLDQVERTLVDLLEKVGNFLASGSIEFDQRYWLKLFVQLQAENSLSKTVETKQLYVSRMLNDIFKQLGSESPDSVDSSYQDYIKLLLDQNKYEVVTSEALWCLSDEQLLKYLTIDSSIVRAGIFQELLVRKIQFTYDNSLFTTNDPLELNSIQALIEQELLNIDLEPTLQSMIKSGQDSPAYFGILKSLIKRVPEFDPTQTIATNEQLAIVFGSCVDLNKYSDLLRNLVESTVENFYLHFDLQYLLLLSNTIEILPKDFVHEVISRILSLDAVSQNAVNLFSPELLSLLLSVKEDLENDEVLIPWLLKSLLYINHTAAQAENFLNDKFLNFMSKFSNFFDKMNVWKYGSKILNTQLEIILGSKLAISNLNFLEYATKVISKSDESVIDYSKLLQIFVNHDNNILTLGAQPSHLRFQAAQIIYHLYYKNTQKNSNVPLQFRLLQFYKGLKTPADLILKQILIDIESATSFNLVNHFSTWEIVDMDEQDADEFIKKEGNSLTITLNQRIISRSIRNYVVEKTTLDVNSLYIQNLYKETQILATNTYDDEFLLLLIINNEELFIDQGENFRIDLKKLVGSNLLQFVVVCLANNNSQIREMAIKILAAVFASLDENKENLYKVYLGNVLSLEQNESSLVVLFYASLLPILKNPSHFMFEKLSKYLLSSSSFKSEVPLFKAISEPTGEDTETYYKQVSWFLETLLSNLKSVKDLKLLTSSKVIEWIMNLVNNKFLSLGSQNLIFAILLKILKLGGVNLLCKSYGLVSWLEIVSSSNIGGTNSVINQQIKLNCEKVSLTLKLLVDQDLNKDNKRKLQEWFDNDLDNHVKRVCL